jgi:acyl-CoA reductase-like NAD-dependent aldehyde dehydrogenase
MARTVRPSITGLPAGLLIGGELVTTTAGGVFNHIDPATGEPGPPVPLAGAADVDAAVSSAASAFREWSGWPADRRRDVLLRFADAIIAHGDELAAISVRDNGVPVSVHGFAPHMAAGGLRYFAGWADKIGGQVAPMWPAPALDYTLDEPYGVVGLIVPWNTPVMNTGLTVAPALAAGNCVVIKPPELAPFALLRYGQIALEAGLPPGVLNIVAGGPAAGEALIRHPGVGKIHFTGSGPTAQRVLATASSALKPVDVELGGKSAVILFPDGDLAAAVGLAIRSGVLTASGQTCLAPSRLLVHESRYREALGLAVELAGRARLGDPFDPETELGPVITAAARDRILSAIGKARDDGAEVLSGGRAAGGALSRGFYIEPTVVGHVDPASELAQQELFGPVLAISSFSTDDEAVRMADGTAYGLGAYIFTNDLKQAHAVARQLQAGNVYVNGFPGLPPAMPFGGVKASGFGRLGGIEGLRSFLRTKNVWISLS